MKQKISLLFIYIFIVGMRVYATGSTIIPRSSSVNAARELVGWQQLINTQESSVFSGAFSVAAEYSKSFKGAQLMRCLFGSDVFLNQLVTSGDCCLYGCNDAFLLVQGSCVTDRNPSAWLADYFGLPTDFNSVIMFSPTIKNTILDFNVYVGLDALTPGLFARVHAPLVWANWNLCAREKLITKASNGFVEGYMNSAGTTTDLIAIPNTSLRQNFLSALDGTYTFGDMQTPLKYGRFCGNTSGSACCTNSCSSSCNTLVRFSDIEAAIGYNFMQCEDYHLGIELRGSAPAGNKPSGMCLFEPIVGNGKFWTLGAGLTTHEVLWRDPECPDRMFAIYADLNVSHLFKSCQRRSLDICDLPNSRYMLIEQFTTPTTNLFANEDPGDVAGSVAPSAQYNGSLQQLINVSTFDFDVSYAAQADLAIKCAWSSNDWEVDLGYEFWGRTKEKLCMRSGNFLENTYALKGDAFIYGFSQGATGPLVANQPVALSATESLATIHSGTNFGIAGFDCNSADFINGTQRANPNVDNAEFARSAAGAVGVAANLKVDKLAGSIQTRTSATPIFIKATDFNMTPCDKSTITHKLFTHISYMVKSSCWSPFIGIGAEAEFAPCSKGNCCLLLDGSISQPCCSSSSCAIAQWGMWVKGGFGFN